MCKPNSYWRAIQVRLSGFTSLLRSLYLLTAVTLAYGIIGSVVADDQGRQLVVACSANERLCQWLQRDEYGLRGVNLHVEYRPAAEVFSVMQATPDDHGIDLWWGAPADRLLAAAALGLLRPIHPANMTQQLRWSTQLWQASERKAVGISATTLGIIFNPISLAPINLPAPRCWSDLGDSVYRGHLLLEDPHLSSELFAAISLIRYHFGSEQADRLLSQIRQNARNGEDSEALRRIAVGDRGITVAPVHEAVQLYSFYSPLTINIPCEGTAFLVAGAAVTAASNQAGPAAAFIEYTLSSSLQSRIVEEVSPQMFSNIQTIPSPIFQERSYLDIINHDPASLYRESDRERILMDW